MSSVPRDKLCSLPNATVMGWTGFKGLTAGFMSPGSWKIECRLARLQQPPPTVWLNEEEGPESNGREGGGR